MAVGGGPFGAGRILSGESFPILGKAIQPVHAIHGELGGTGFLR